MKNQKIKLPDNEKNLLYQQFGTIINNYILIFISIFFFLYFYIRNLILH